MGAKVKPRRPILYIIHGWTYTVEPWEKTVAFLEKQGLKIEILHVPGLTSPSKKVWTIEEYAHWADRNIPDGAVALGHSNGGRILLNLCATKPGKLSHLILLDSAGVYENSVKRDTARSLSKRFGFLKKIPGLTRVWHKVTGASDYARAPENMKKTLSNMLNSDKKLDLSKVRVPTSILWGEDDTITPPHQAEVMHEKIIGSTLSMFPGWTHAPYISHPAELAKVIFRTLKQPPELPPEVTNAANVSASLSLKKAAEPEVPSTAAVSASLAMKKAAGPSAEDSAARSASLAVPSTKPRKGLAPRPAKPAEPNHQALPEPGKIVASLKEVDYEQAEFSLPPRPAVSSSSVPKVSKITKVRRKLKGKKS